MKMLNPADILKIGLMAFVFVWGANRVLDKAGLSEFLPTN